MNKESFLELLQIKVKRILPVHGGDINKAWRIETTDNTSFFLKENNANKYPDMFSLEAVGLHALKENSRLLVPEVIAHHSELRNQYLLLEWMETFSVSPNFWEKFGESLALMHRAPQLYFGWKNDNYIGSLRQVNEKKQSWAEFYSQCRIQPLVKKLFDSGLFTNNDMKSTDKLCAGLHNIFPEEPPSFLHGDLWSGNFLCGTGGKAAIFDPAVYYGHREMDIGMTKLFGGFDNRLYEVYNETHPLLPGWQERIQLTQLYPVLVHAILFGGHYIQQASGIIMKYA